ncbi:LysR family transcriptional regulator [Nitrincola alkalilacustris]|uniref:LysR family transcriptional regulator n=1 Tax=Nitrincola alkalilacustris TaxID=1571224 RepID=UPI001F1139B9|nr:LysR family transcriptional regulator [Nitrincola alkalilacustris]
MTTKLSTKHMQMMAAVADTGSVSDAAHRIGVTQSALSHRLKEAERLLGTELFYRNNKQLTPTSAGKRLLYSARVILAELERAETDINKLSVGIEHVIRLGNDAFAGYHWLPSFMKIFCATHPSISLEVIPDLTLDPYGALRDGRIDLAVVSDLAPISGFRNEPLFQDELRVVMPASHPLAGSPYIGIEAITAETYITHHTNPDSGREYEQLFSRYNRLPVRVIRAGVTDAVIGMVRAGLGITIMPAWTLEPYLSQGGLYTSQTTASGLKIDWRILLRKDEQDESPVFTFAKALKAHIQEQYPRDYLLQRAPPI